jgi:hypothetical protein
VGRGITPAEAAAQGDVIYQTGWPRRWGLFRMCCVLTWMAVLVLGLWVTPNTASELPQTKLLFTLGWAGVVVLALLGVDTVTITKTAVRRRSYLSALLRRGFRTVDLAPNSWFVRPRFSSTGVLWVGSRPHASPKQDVLTMRLEFQDDPKALMNALSSVGVEIEDERADWFTRRPFLARAEMLLLAACALALPVEFVLGPSAVFVGALLLNLVALAVVHWKAR